MRLHLSSGRSAVMSHHPYWISLVLLGVIHKELSLSGTGKGISSARYAFHFNRSLNFLWPVNAEMYLSSFTM